MIKLRQIVSVTLTSRVWIVTEIGLMVCVLVWIADRLMSTPVRNVNIKRNRSIISVSGSVTSGALDGAGKISEQSKPVKLALQSDELRKQELPEDDLFAIVVNSSDKPIWIYRGLYSQTFMCELRSQSGEVYGKDTQLCICLLKPRLSSSEAMKNLIRLDPNECYGTDIPTDFIHDIANEIPMSKRKGLWKMRVMVEVGYPTYSDVEWKQKPFGGWLWSPEYTVRLRQETHQ